MQVELKQLNAAKREVTLTIPADQAEKEYRIYFNQSASMVQIPGFRKGKAPMSMVERSHGARIREYFVEMMTEKSFREAAKEHKIEHLFIPEVTKIDWEPGTDMTITLEIESEPEFTIAQIEGLTVPYKPFPLEQDVLHYLADLREKDKIIVEAEDGIRENDEVQLEMRLASKPEGEFWTVEVRLDAREQDLLEALKDKKIGDTVEMEMSAKHFTRLTEAKEVEVKEQELVIIMVNAIRREHFPEIDDEFARDHEFEDLADMKAKIGEELTPMNIHRNIYAKHNGIINKLLQDNRFDLPEKALDYLTEHEMKNYAHIKSPQYRQYMEYQIRYEIMKDMIKTYLFKNLFAQYPCEVTDEDKQRYYEHVAILTDTTVEAWKEKNKERLEQNQFDSSILEFTLLEKIATTCEFIEKEDEPEAEDNEESEVMPDDLPDLAPDADDPINESDKEDA